MKVLKIYLLVIFLSVSCYLQAQKPDLLPIEVIGDSTEFVRIIKKINHKRNALFVFDVDNTLLITNENDFGSDWWYTQTKSNPALKLGISSECLFDVLTPLFYAMFETTALFAEQPRCVNALAKGKSRTIALTSRGYNQSVATSTELALRENDYAFLQKDSVYLAKNVVMLNGVIYTKGQNKGEILLQYIRDKSYDEIFYFDDSLFKVEDVQEAFSGTDHQIRLFHVEVAPKVPYTPAEVEHMQLQLCNVINTVNRQSAQKICSCEDQ